MAHEHELEITVFDGDLGDIIPALNVMVKVGGHLFIIKGSYLPGW